MMNSGEAKQSTGAVPSPGGFCAGGSLRSGGLGCGPGTQLAMTAIG